MPDRPMPDGPTTDGPTTDRPAIGFIGLGLMGSAMAQRLLDLGYPLTVIANRRREGVEAAVERGAAEAGSARELAGASEVVMLCMGTSASVEARMLGEDGVIAGLREGGLVIDFGTSLPDSTRRIGEAVEAAGASYMDAPLGRTPSHGAKGSSTSWRRAPRRPSRAPSRSCATWARTCSMWARWAPAHAQAHQQLLRHDDGLRHVGGLRHGRPRGHRARRALRGHGGGPLRSGMMDFVKAQAVDGKPDMLAFSIVNARKDVGYYGRMADDLGAPSVMGAAAKQALSLAVAEGWGERMVPEMVDYLAGLYRGRG